MTTQQIDIINRTLKGMFSTQSAEIQECIESCMNCHRICEQILPYCLEKGGMHAQRRHIELLLSCADVTRTAAHLMMWNSDQYQEVCNSCAEICIECAGNCEQMGDDQNMSACAALCRKCADSCRLMMRH